MAQEPAPQDAQKQSGGAANVLGTVGKWLDDSFSTIGSTFKGAGGQVQNFGREAGVAAQSAGTAAKDAADAMWKLPTARMVSGHEKCVLAPNGAPDCVAAANAVCKSKGFTSGKSMDMTTADKCPPRVWLGQAGPEACTTETFVSRALCQ